MKKINLALLVAGTLAVTPLSANATLLAPGQSSSQSAPASDQDKDQNKDKDRDKDVGDKIEDAGAAAGGAVKDGAEAAADKTKEGVSKAGNEITDAWIISRVKSEFVDEDLLKGSDINVDSDNQMVTLKGTVKSNAGRERALAIAKKVEGVKSVKDQLVVK